MKKAPNKPTEAEKARRAEASYPTAAERQALFVNSKGLRYIFGASFFEHLSSADQATLAKLVTFEIPPAKMAGKFEEFIGKNYISDQLNQLSPTLRLIMGGKKQ